MDFPNQCIPETDKQDREKFGIPCIRYGLSLLDENRYNKMTRLYKSYNGERTPESTQWITNVYGIESRAPFTSYKVGRAKQYLLEGEWLKRPLNATVRTINISAQSEKMEHMDLMYGAMLAKDYLGDIKNKVGVDVMEGAEIPESEDDPRWKEMSPKDKQEDIMQIIVNNQIKELMLIMKFSENFKDARIVAMCWGKVEINEKGEVDYIWFDPRDAVFEEIAGDPFCERSVIKGGRRWIPLHEALMRYTLTKEDREILESVKNNNGAYPNFKTSKIGGVTMIEEVHVEWKSSKPTYYKIMPKTEKQLEYDNERTEIEKIIPPEVYEANKAKYDRGVEKGEFKIEVKYEEDIWEGTSLGRTVFVNIRRKPFQLRPHDDPSKILSASYIGCLFGTTDGKRISLQELIENFDLQFDYCEYQIMKDLGRAKGKALLYDLAALPKNTTAAKLLNQILNDGFATFNSAAAGNVMNRNYDLANAFKELDLGFSQSFPLLLQLQNQILATLDRITGINEYREGTAPSSATVGNAQQGLQNSRTITEPLFYMMQLYVQKVMKVIVESTKISWAFYKLDKGEQILGTDKYTYMKVSRDLGYRDYGVHIEDGSVYSRLRERMDKRIEFGLNSKEISMADAARYELSESTVEALSVFQDAEQRLIKISQQMQQEQLASQEKMNQQNLETQVGIANADREDRQAADLEIVAAQTEGQLAVVDRKIQGKLLENQHKSEQDIIKDA